MPFNRVIFELISNDSECILKCVFIAFNAKWSGVPRSVITHVRYNTGTFPFSSRKVIGCQTDSKHLLCQEKIPSTLFNHNILDSSPHLCYLLCTNTLSFYFHQIFYERQFCAWRPKHICLFLNTFFAYIIHRLQTVWNQTKSKKTFSSHSVKRKIDYYWSIFCFPSPSLHKHCSPTKTQNYI